MCGLVAVVKENGQLSENSIHSFHILAKKSQRRGSDSSGIVKGINENIFIYRMDSGISGLLKKLDLSPSNFIAGHSRLATHGDITAENIQPVLDSGWVILHNGIITNSSKFTNKDAIDSLAINMVLKNCDIDSKSIAAALNKLTGEISLIGLHTSGYLLLYTNVGGIYSGKNSEDTLFFASEETFLKDINCKDISQLSLNTPYILRLPKDLYNIVEKSFNSGSEIKIEKRDSFAATISEKYHVEILKILKSRKKAEMCRRCLLPKNFAGLNFDEFDQCELCQLYQPIQLLGEDTLKTQVFSKNKKVLVNLSGGRDSCYVLHKAVEFGFQPTAFTYDWGFVSTAARENMAKICGKLGVEHIVISPNLQINRLVVKEVLKGWLEKCDPATIPLLMAGDKPLLSKSIQVAKELGNIPILHGDHYLESTHFKSALAGARYSKSNGTGTVSYRLPLRSILQMSIRYLSLLRYIKKVKIKVSSQLVSSALIYYLKKHPFYSVFNYIPWNEDEIESALQIYDWSNNNSDVQQNWRMGDSTAPLYNLLYLLLIGYCENDALISNKVRAGILSRDEGVIELEKLNSPDFKGIEAYLSLIDFDSKEFWEKLTHKVKFDEFQV